MLDLNNPEHAYLFGFLQADGHLASGTGQKGRLTVELMLEDRPLLERFATIVPVYSSITERKRTTNFSEQYSSVVWTVSNLAFRLALQSLGLPAGKKVAYCPTSL